MLADDQGFGHVALVNRELNGGLGLYVSFDVTMLPYLSEWKMMGQGEYVLGIEPANVPCLKQVRAERTWRTADAGSRGN